MRNVHHQYRQEVPLPGNTQAPEFHPQPVELSGTIQGTPTLYQTKGDQSATPPIPRLDILTFRLKIKSYKQMGNWRPVADETQTAVRLVGPPATAFSHCQLGPDPVVYVQGQTVAESEKEPREYARDTIDAAQVFVLVNLPLVVKPAPAKPEPPPMSDPASPPGGGQTAASRQARLEAARRK